MHCRCGRETMLAHGMCATCYTLRRQDEEHFGGLRETVLERDGYRCRVCDAPGTGKAQYGRSPSRPRSVGTQVDDFSSRAGARLATLLVRVHRTKVVLAAAMPPDYCLCSGGSSTQEVTSM